MPWFRLRNLPDGVGRRILLLWIADILVGISYGAIAVAYGLSAWIPIVLAVTVVAGASEFVFVGVVAAGGSPLAAAAAGLLVNARHLPYGFAVSPLMPTFGSKLVGAHITNDESMVFALSQRGFDAKKAAFWVCGLAILVSWSLGTIIGSLLGDVLHDVRALGLDSVFPAALVALIVPELRNKGMRGSALVGSLIAASTVWVLPVGLPELVALGGLLALPVASYFSRRSEM